ncbi:MAG: YfcE family phosphodiesterase [Candidatus Lokiarchaeota archaeon]|nr:YfcE family phosphodiesterase [Candidatus Lokiarchaeota archaeon]
MLYYLVLGDSHIPRRVKSIPAELQKKIVSLSEDRSFDQIFFTGDVIHAPELIAFLKSRSIGGFSRVLGNMDYYEGNRDAPIYQEIKVRLSENTDLIIGLTHGAEIKPRGDKSQLERLAINKRCNILISGHTHKEEIFLSPNGVLLLNPGSCTGAWSFVASQIPSFITIEISQKQHEFSVFLYQLNKLENIIESYSEKFLYSNGRIIFG